MPTKPRTKVRTYKKKRGRKQGPLAPIGQSIGFPREQTVRLRYCQTVTLASTVGALGYHQFRANSLFDPDYTSTGHQPLIYDVYSSLYNHYQVLGSKISAVLLPNSDLTTPHVCGIYLSDDITTYTTWDAFQESGRSMPKSIQSIEKPARLVAKFGLKKFFTKSVDNGATSALVSTNPAEEAFYTIWLQPVDTSTSSSSSVLVRVQIDFVARFFEPKDIAQS